MKRLTALLLALLMLFTLAACGGESDSPSPPEGPVQQPDGPGEPAPAPAPTDTQGDNVIRVARNLNSCGNLDTLLTTYTQIFESSNAVFDQLVITDPVTMELQPCLLTKLPEVSEEGKLFTFELKQGVKFHDGVELTAKDVEFTFNRFFDPQFKNVNTWMADMITGAKDMIDGNADTLAGFTVIDDYHFTIRLDYSFTAFISVLAVSPLNIVPKDACLAAGERWGIDTLVGTGPFILESFEPNVEIVLKRNDNYHGGRVEVDGVDIINMDDNTALIEWEAGNVDVSLVDVSLVDNYLDNPDFAGCVQEQEFLGIHALNMNQKIKPFDDIRVRQAVGLATNTQELCDGYFKGHMRPAKSIIPPGILGYDDSLELMEYNPEKAKQLLAEAGYPDGVTITATVTETSSFVEIYQVLQEQYKKANITLEIEKVDAAGWTDKRSSGNVQFFLMNWYADFADPDNFLYSLYHSSVADFFSTGYVDAEWDAKLDKGRTIAGLAEKQAYYEELADFLSREAYVEFPMYVPTGYLLVSDRVDGVILRKDNGLSYVNARVLS